MPNGILLLDKPPGLSSNAALQRVRRAFGRVKAGHTGSLDPLATGMLPVCLGEATKVAGFLLDGDKQYAFTMAFGQRTSTGDLEGEVVEQCPVPNDIAAALAAPLRQFLGTVQQVPPMYSALKQGGQPLYRLARQGITVQRETRSVTIHALTLLATDDRTATLSVRCSKGTYVRTLAEDLARASGSCAHLTLLRRTVVEPFAGQGMVSLESVEADPERVALLAPDAALPHLPALALGAEATRRLRQGQTVALEAVAAPEGLARVYGPEHVFLGLGQIQRRGDLAELKPVRLFNDLAADAT